MHYDRQARASSRHGSRISYLRAHILKHSRYRGKTRSGTRLLISKSLSSKAVPSEPPPTATPRWRDQVIKWMRLSEYQRHVSFKPPQISSDWAKSCLLKDDRFTRWKEIHQQVVINGLPHVENCLIITKKMKVHLFIQSLSQGFGLAPDSGRKVEGVFVYLRSTDLVCKSLYCWPALWRNTGCIASASISLSLWNGFNPYLPSWGAERTVR